MPSSRNLGWKTPGTGRPRARIADTPPPAVPLRVTPRHRFAGTRPYPASTSAPALNALRSPYPCTRRPRRAWPRRVPCRRRQPPSRGAVVHLRDIGVEHVRVRARHLAPHRRTRAVFGVGDVPLAPGLVVYEPFCRRRHLRVVHLEQVRHLVDNHVESVVLIEPDVVL